MKLISMTDFVLQDNGNILNMEYANFLKQTLELGMFVTCDEEGNILDSSDQFRSCGKGFVYGQAKEKVLFEGFEKDSSFVTHKNRSSFFYPISSLHELTI